MRRKSSALLVATAAMMRDRKMLHLTARCKMAVFVELVVSALSYWCWRYRVRTLCRQYTIIMLHSYLHRHGYSRCVGPVLGRRISCNHAKFRLDELEGYHYSQTVKTYVRGCYLTRLISKPVALTLTPLDGLFHTYMNVIVPHSKLLSSCACLYNAQHSILCNSYNSIIAKHLGVLQF